MKASSPPETSTVIFLHIHKAAGTTLHRIIERQYPPDQIWSFDERHDFEAFRALSEAQKEEIRMLRGHMIFGLHELMPRPCIYFTLLRDPVERVISFYDYIRRNPHHYHSEMIVSQSLTLQQFLETRTSTMMNNGQTRMLAGARQYDFPVGECTEELLEAAKSNLKDWFAVVGLVERFDESLLLLQRVLGWGRLFYVRQNVAERRPRQEDLPTETLELVKRHNALDLELYQYASTFFREQIRQQGKWFEGQVRLFQLANRLLPQTILPTGQPHKDRQTDRGSRNSARGG
jgi:hypothetical protein